jgi:hypothetical protein
VLAAVGLYLQPTPARALASFLLRRAQIRLRGLGYHERSVAEVPIDLILRVDICWTVAIGLGVIDPIQGAEFQTRHLLLALQSGEPYRVARALTIEAGFESMRGGRGRARADRLLVEAQAIARRLDHPHALGLHAMGAAIAAALQGRWRAARAEGERAEAILTERCTGVEWELDCARIVILSALMYTGELALLEDRMLQHVEDARQRGDLYAQTGYCTLPATTAMLAADRPEEARRQVTEVMQTWSHAHRTLQHHWELLAHGSIDLYLGDGATARGRLEDKWEGLEQSMLLRIQQVRVAEHDLRGRSALQAAQAADGAEQQALLAAAERDAGRILGEKLPWAAPLAQLISAGVANLRGDRARAGGLLHTAVAGFERADMGLHAAVARRRAAALAGNEAARVAAEGWMVRQRVVNPRRMSALYAPGFSDED